MADYHVFVSLRQTIPDWPTLLLSIRTAVNDATVAGQPDLAVGTYRLKRQGTWSAPDIASVQALIDAAAPVTARTLAQAAVDNWPIEQRALILALVDQINILRAAVNPPLSALSPSAAVAAIRAKAGTL